MELLQAAEDGLHLVNDGDIVPAFPPSLSLLAAASTLLPGGLTPTGYVGSTRPRLRAWSGLRS